MNKLSVLIPCHNAEKTIRATLESVKWADEILIVDSFSTDQTLAICREYTDRIVQHDYINSARQKNWAIPQCKYDWILEIDSDEELETELKVEIQAAISSPNAEIHCYKIPRKNYVYGKWVKSLGYPDYQTRLFRKTSSKYEDKSVHAHIITSGKYGILRHHLIHHDFKDIATYLLKFERYMRYELEELLRKNRKLHWSDLYIKPLAVFIHTYFIRGGWKEGFQGLLSAKLTSWYVFMKYVKLWEHEWKQSKLK